MKIISVRKTPESKERVTSYIQSKWNSVPSKVYDDSITHSLTTENPLPQWYLLEKDDKIIGCAGLITNDFISRMDLYPWICAVYIEEDYRGNSYSSLLLEKAKRDAAQAGFDHVYLSTELEGFYERFGFKYIGQGYHPWDEESRIYGISVKGILDIPDITIREVIEQDYTDIYKLIRIAFKTANVKDGDEQDFAVGLRESDNHIPELELVAEHNGKIIGHIMLTQTIINHSDGTEHPTLLVAPLSVLLEYRSRGVGTRLIQEALRLARELGYTSAFLVGDPNYYTRLGYKKASDYGVYSKNGIPEQYVLAQELVPDGLYGIEGIIEAF